VGPWGWWWFEILILSVACWAGLSFFKFLLCGVQGFFRGWFF